jgi:hypothetical protein
MSGPRPIDGDPSVASLRSECRGSGTLFFWARHPERSEGSPARVRRATVRRLRPRPLARDSSLRFAPFRMTWSATPAQLHPPLHCEPGGASAASRPSGPSGSAPSPAAPGVPDARRASLPRSATAAPVAPIVSLPQDDLRASVAPCDNPVGRRLPADLPGHQEAPQVQPHPGCLIHGCRTHAVRPYPVRKTAAPVAPLRQPGGASASSRPSG